MIKLRETKNAVHHVNTGVKILNDAEELCNVVNYAEASKYLMEMKYKVSGFKHTLSYGFDRERDLMVWYDTMFVSKRVAYSSTDYGRPYLANEYNLDEYAILTYDFGTKKWESRMCTKEYILGLKRTRK